MTTQTQHTFLDEFRRDFAGEMIIPESPGYDEARTIFNGMIDRRPGVIALRSRSSVSFCRP